MMRILALLHLASGALVARVRGTFQEAELRLFMGLRNKISSGSIVVGDCHYGCFMLAAALKKMNVDLIARLSKKRTACR